jgi:transposase InsO family protein
MPAISARPSSSSTRYSAVCHFVHVVQTYNGGEFQSQFHWHLESRDVRHRYIRPRTPRLNGKVERSHRVDDQEFYQLLDRDGITDDAPVRSDFS